MAFLSLNKCPSGTGSHHQSGGRMYLVHLASVLSSNCSEESYLTCFEYWGIQIRSSVVNTFGLPIPSYAHAYFTFKKRALSVSLVVAHSGCSKHLGSRGRSDNLKAITFDKTMEFVVVCFFPFLTVGTLHGVLVAPWRLGGINVPRQSGCSRWFNQFCNHAACSPRRS